MKRVGSLLSGIVLLATIGVGSASADPVNKNSRYITVNCESEIFDIVVVSGGAGHVLGDTRVLVLHGVTDHGVWLIPLSNGQSKADLMVCPYVTQVEGHDYVAYFSISGPPH